MNSVNRRTKLIISRLLTAVFLFVILCTPISALASGESVSDNGSDEEFESWEDALSDSDYTDNLAENIARTWASYFESYVGTREDVINEVADYIGDTYDRTVSLYDNLYPYILPYAKQTVNEIDSSNLSISIYGKPIRNKNNLKLINDYMKTMENNLPSSLVNIAGSKYKGSDITFDVFPSWLHIENTCKCNLPKLTPVSKNHLYFTGSNYYDATTYYLVNNNNPGCYLFHRLIYSQPQQGVSTKVVIPIGVSAHAPYMTTEDYQPQYNKDWRTDYNNLDWSAFIDGQWPVNTSAIISGSCYLGIKNGNVWNYYFYDDDNKTLITLNTEPGQNGYFDQNNIVKTDTYEFNIINSVDFTEYNDLLNELMIDVNMSNAITNSLLIELLTELRNQRDVYEPISDDDDIYDYIDYMMQKLMVVKDIHIEIPDISPDLGGIATALSALLNFLASIIRAIGDIVSSLLDGLFHLFVPTTDQWAELTLDFDTVMNPFRWIRGFLGEGVNAVSICLFGSNVTDITNASDELEIVNASVAATRGEPSEHSSSHANIVYDEDTGAPKIPVHFSNSTSEYFSDIGDAYIIDMNWYAPFKPVGDVIVVAFCWIMFIWRVIRDLPGIINGTSGITDNNPDTYSGEVNKQSTWHRISGR